MSNDRTPCDACLRDDCVGRCCTRCHEQRGVRYDGWGDGGTWCQACLDEVHERHQRLRCLAVLGEVIAAAIEAERLTREYGWERRVITVHTVADWDEASQKWVMR